MTLYSTAFVIVLISISGALFFVKRNRALDQTIYKILMFGLYFWLLIFVQAIVCSFIYQYFLK